MSDDTRILSVRGLNVQIPIPGSTLWPVRDVNIDVGRGETVAVVGESGCGKSLTALAIMGLLPRQAKVQSEALRLNAESLAEASPKRWRQLRGDRIAMIFQDPMTALDPCYRIGDQMCEILQQHRKISRSAAMKRSLDLLGKVGIPAPEERLKQYPHQLSGGLRQRVMIAMALLCEPELIIADEPTTALDVTIQAQILRLLRDIQRETNIGLLLITHDLGVVAGMADRIVVMYGGEVVEVGTCDQVLAQPLHPYTEGLVRSIPVPGETEQGEALGYIPGIVPRQVGERTACGFVDRCPYATSACREEPIAMRDAGDGRLMRCILPTDGSARDPDVWILPDETSAQSATNSGSL
ncbi:peptide/nickel transport system ATP-binding protein [Roseovarius halotolerans]|uniref:Oligopeptide transport ATP-binding protein OppD n=1 Tax=Roseovarius halotolerans TaxID=505353 RepID=A0A1X6YQ58_9RHOB|nr:ABC transporter ATP-binding protein [Roseovarius halotolerans]RKT34013.1 peptide/nickel transport system ATP-binding protein [Roseovarius halotolerans]SLN28163.1 Oligopeptide transport ATP-binding protein OppD [Roseovarius halotolerans]